MPLIDNVVEIASEAASWRQDIHSHPELMFDVHRTADLVADKLKEFGCDEVVTGIGQTGVVAVIEGKKNHSGKVVGLRADMDGLPIQEATGLPYESLTPGVMHACGHDGHTAVLLATAKRLASTRNFDGKAVLVFQPDEEAGNGCLAMINNGLMDRFGIQEIYGLHNMPDIPIGHFAIRKGPIMAAGDRFTIQISGKGGHAAKPEECNDVVLASSHTVVALHSIIPRNVTAMEPAVLSVCSIQAGNTFSVLPPTSKILGTVRTAMPETRDLIESRIKEVAENIASTFNVRAEIDYDRRVPATINHAEQTEFLASVASEVSTVTEGTLHMGGEDFAYMLLERPGAYIFMGNGSSTSLHSPQYDFNDDAIPYGVSLWVRAIERRMPV